MQFYDLKGIPNNTAEVMFGNNPNLEIQMAYFAGIERLTFLDIQCHMGLLWFSTDLLFIQAMMAI
jgi:hypothetical protein